jgi:DNA-binding response OmpR family regulator
VASKYAIQGIRHLVEALLGAADSLLNRTQLRRALSEWAAGTRAGALRYLIDRIRKATQQAVDGSGAARRARRCVG